LNPPYKIKTHFILGEISHIDFKPVIELIENAQSKVFRAINAELVTLYWNIGKYVSERVATGEWGDGVVLKLSEVIQKQYPNLKGFTARGLYRMRQFFEIYDGNEKVSTLLTQLNWSNHLTILSKCKSMEEKEFYIHFSVKERWSQRTLVRQIETSMFERTMLAQRGAPLATQISGGTSDAFKDTYIFEFLDLPTDYSETNLQHHLIANMKHFLMELGGGFTFVGQEYRVQVGMHDYYIDLLFFHRQLQCLVAVELKTVEFTPEHLGKMNFYLEALDSNVKMPHENPSVGILICKGKDSEVVEYAFRRSLSQAFVADYETKIIDKKILQAKVHELYGLFTETKN
jgi:predicted nuclease of restriction endonuclease-like (RecB) superfamily